MKSRHEHSCRPFQVLEMNSKRGRQKIAQVFLVVAAVCIIQLVLPNSVLDGVQQYANPTDTAVVAYIPSSLDEYSQRRLSLDLGDGDCLWAAPEYRNEKIPDDLPTTIIAGYPSAGKRLIFLQMESLTGWPTKDEWDFEFQFQAGSWNHPFIKANYPHHEGIWGWKESADHVVMEVRDIRKCMYEYHDIRWDLGYADDWVEAQKNVDNLYSKRPPLDDFLEWRDERVLDEVSWYAWVIDYWMESGLMRDMFTHKVTTPAHWNMLTDPTAQDKHAMSYNIIVGDHVVVEPSYDPNCLKMSGGCTAKAVVSAEVLENPVEGKNETAVIATILQDVGLFPVIDETTWGCIWEELIVDGKGNSKHQISVYDRPDEEATVHKFSEEMLEKMFFELTYLTDKYSGDEWNTIATANRLVTLLSEHRADIQEELNELNSVRRRGQVELKDTDFLGPETRAERRLLRMKEKVQAGELDAIPDTPKQDNSNYFFELEKQFTKKKYNSKKARATRLQNNKRARVLARRENQKKARLDV